MKPQKKITRSSTADRSGLTSAFLNILLPLCGFWAFYDIIISILQHSPPAYRSFIYILPALGTACLSLLLISLLVCLVFILPLHFVVKRSVEALIFSWIVLFSTFMLILISNNVEYPIFIYMKPYTFIYPALISVIMGFIAYIGYIKTGTNWKSSGRLISMIPVMGMEAMLIVWFFSYHLILKNLNTYVLMLICMAATGTLTVRLFQRKRPGFFRTKIPVLFLAFIVFSVLTGLSRIVSRSSEQSIQSVNSPIKRILLLSVDTLRPDFLTCYNTDALETPGIDQLAEDGILFQQAFSTSPWTLPSFASVMTGLPVSTHMTYKREHVLSDTFRTLAEILHEAGYITAAIGYNKNLTRPKNICQGFDEYHFFPTQIMTDLYGSSLGASLYYYHILHGRTKSSPSTADLTEMAVKWLKTHREYPFFLWLHYLDPHLPYQPPETYLEDIKTPVGMPRTLMAEAASKIRSGIFKLSTAKKEYIKRLYNAEIKYVDDHIAILIKTLKELNLYENTLIIFFSDHGEEFWEHGGFEHGHTLYNELLWVPFIVKPAEVSSQKEKRTFQKKVSLLNVMPTILDLCGIDPEQEELYEKSLSVCWGNGLNEYKERPIVSSGLLYFENRQSVINREIKYIRFDESGTEELYNLSSDPKELFPLQDSSPLAVQYARKLLNNENLQSLKIRKKLGILGPRIKALTPEDKKALKSIGYLN